MKVLSRRFKYDEKLGIRLNGLQVEMKKQIERKIKEGVCSFGKAPCCVCGTNDFEVLSK